MTLEKTFSCFSGLPKEIRLQIWEHLFPGPRTVYLSKTLRISHLAYASSEEDAQYDSKERTMDSDEEETDFDFPLELESLFKEISPRFKIGLQISSFRSACPVATLFLFNHESFLYSILANFSALEMLIFVNKCHADETGDLAFMEVAR
ncbi:hypothetical protein N431DRAFT_463549 [Stipitochalara longipes BDJ]|nr:hypothetical protein N431DRAFT_463549 [Stipitochalara longipes BDJ]